MINVFEKYNINTEDRAQHLMELFIDENAYVYFFRQNIETLKKNSTNCW